MDNIIFWSLLFFTICFCSWNKYRCSHKYKAITAHPVFEPGAKRPHKTVYDLQCEKCGKMRFESK